MNIHCASDEVLIVCNREKIIYLGTYCEEAEEILKENKGFQLLAVPFGDHETLIK